MGTPATPPVAAPAMFDKSGTTLRGMATASFCLGCWSDLTFWWYPFGLSVAVVAIGLGLFTLALGVVVDCAATETGESVNAYSALTMHRFLAEKYLIWFITHLTCN